MSYVIETWDNVELDFSGSYLVPTDPLNLQIDFVTVDPVDPEPPLFTPRLSAEYRATIRTADFSAGSSGVLIKRAAEADNKISCSFKRALQAGLNLSVCYEDSNNTERAVSICWSEAVASAASTVLIWGNPPPIYKQHSHAWNTAIWVDHLNFISGWIMKTPARDAIKSKPWYSVNLSGNPYDDSAARMALLQTDTATTVSLAGFSGAIVVTPLDGIRLNFGYVQPKRPIVPHDKTTQLTARHANTHDNRKLIPWGTGESLWHDYNLPYPVEENPIIIDPTDPPRRKVVYLTMNTLTITDIATGTPLDIQGVTISLDIDSLSWKFSGTVYGQATLDLVAPDNEGMKDISITINTHQWVFAIERYTSDEKFPTQKFNISGVSRTQYMAAPFAPVRSYTNAIGTTAAQAATAELDGTGFSLNWPLGDDDNLPDWGIPAGALSFRDKSPAQVVAQIVTASGGVMIPSMAADSWTIQPRYKTSPWQWDEVTPDAAIYIGMVRSRSAQFEPSQAYDACYVSGINQGVAVDVQLTGSGGLNPMPDIYDDLITDTQPAISRGRNELAASGNKVVETLSVMIPEGGAAPGIIKPGMIVSVTYDDSTKDYIALVLSTSISVQRAGAAEIYQNVTVERTA